MAGGTSLQRSDCPWCQSRMRFPPRHYVCSWDKITSASATVHCHRPEGSHSSTGGVILSFGVILSGESLYPLTPELLRVPNYYLTSCSFAR